MRKYVWAAVCSTLVTACGGGGGSDAPVLQPTLGITGANQMDVARTSAGAAISMAGAGSSVTASSGGPGVAALPGLSRQIALALDSSRKTALSAQAQAIEPLGSPQSCPAGGSATATYDDANGNRRLDIGEALTFTFVHCKSTVDDDVNGTISVTLQNVGTTTAGISFTGAMSLNLTATVGTRTSTAAGSVQATYTDVSGGVSRTELTVGLSALIGTVVIPGIGSETITYEQGFSIATTDSASGSTTSTNVSGAISASGLVNGRIVLATPIPIVQLAADPYPSSGAMRVNGTSGSTLLITAVSATQVRLQLDQDGNGSYEGDQTLPWDTVLPSTAN